MKSYEQRTESITQKIEIKRAHRKAWISLAACVCCVAIVCTAAFVPLSLKQNPQYSNPPIFGSINVPEDSDYAPLVEKLEEYHSSKLYLDSLNESHTTTFPGGVDGSQASAPNDSTVPSAVESTPNQVKGINEGDLVKHSTTHAYRLLQHWQYNSEGKCIVNYSVEVYSLQKSQSQHVASFGLDAKDGISFGNFSHGWFVGVSDDVVLGDSADRYYTFFETYISGGNFEMLLSADASTLTVFADCVSEENCNYTAVILLDISNPANILEKSRTYVAGSYKTCRQLNGEYLLFTTFDIPSFIDYDKTWEYVPNYGDITNPDYFTMDEILCPDAIAKAMYTVVAKVSDTTLEVTDRLAMLSYCEDIAVFADHIIVTQRKTVWNENGVDVPFAEINNTGFSHYYTEIVLINYKESLSNAGSVWVKGYVKDRYSIDEKDGILRVITNDNITNWQHRTIWLDQKEMALDNFVVGGVCHSVNLYCVDIATMEVVASVEDFAPKDEFVRAVRFDGDMVYVCTAVQTTDPVFAFDLSDLSNITCKDTGTIPGYSINLVKFGENLLGIGIDNNRSTLKVELYSEEGSSVKSIAVFKQDMCSYASEYKAHFVDAERQLVGVQVYRYNENKFPHWYLLLHFNGSEFEVLLCEKVDNCNFNNTRAFYDEGLYVFTDGSTGFFYFPIDSEN